MLIPSKVLNIVKSASNSATRYQLVGVYIERKTADSQPTITATDGRVIAQATWREEPWQDCPIGNMDVSPKEGFSCILPRKAAEEVSE